MARLVLLLALVFIVVPQSAFAHDGNDDPNVVHACVNNTTNVARIVGVNGVCMTTPRPHAETPMHWQMVGPQGEAGQNGEDGQKGEKGDPGNLALAGQICPAGAFVAGFDLSGAVICRAPGSTEPIPPGWIPIPLAQGEQVETYLENLSGTEINRSTPFQFSVPFVGTVQGNFNMLGFAMCEPADPLAAPGVTPPIFGCVPTVGVTFVADSPSEATLTVNAGAIFAAFGGNWDAPFPLGSGPIQGYVLLEGVTIQLGVALVDAEDGQKRFGAVTTRALQWQTRTIDITFGNSLVDGVAGLAINLATSSLIADVRGLAAASVETALASMPPFVLQP